MRECKRCGHIEPEHFEWPDCSTQTERNFYSVLTTG
jgi:hypothetical protein